MTLLNLFCSGKGTTSKIETNYSQIETYLITMNCILSTYLVLYNMLILYTFEILHAFLVVHVKLCAKKYDAFLNKLYELIQYSLTGVS